MAETILPHTHAKWSLAIVKVGDGRGFIVDSGHEHRIITAAHCLPHLPPPHGGSYLDERVYKNLISRLGSKRKKVCAQCIFADPVADLAVFDMPDNQALWQEADDYALSSRP
jgi:hypothetical protein